MLKLNKSKVLLVLVLVTVVSIVILINNKKRYLTISRNDTVHIDNKILTITNTTNKNSNIKRAINKKNKIIILKNNTEIYSYSVDTKRDLMFNDDNLKLEIK